MCLGSLAKLINKEFVDGIVLLICLASERMLQTQQYRDCKRAARLCYDRVIARAAALDYRFGTGDLPPSATGRHVGLACSDALANPSRVDKSRHRLR